jgi:hypothetical protein
MLNNLTENFMKTHFTSNDYLHIKTETGNYSLPAKNLVDVQTAANETQERIARLSRRLAAYNAYLAGETVSHPDALRID